MSPRQTTHVRLPPPPAEPLRVVNPDAAGIDIHADVHWVAVPPDRAPESGRPFGAFTCDLEAIADWLARCRVTTVVMESTGVSWIPLFEWLERRGFRVLLIDPRQAQRASGQRHPQYLATFRDRHCKHDEATIAKALHGNWREDHLFELQQAMELSEFYHAKLAACDQ